VRKHLSVVAFYGDPKSNILIEEDNGDDDNNRYSPVAQGQAGINDNFDSDGSSYSFRAVPDSDEEDWIQNTDANESLYEKEDAQDDEQGAEPPEEQDPDMEFEEDIRNYIADIEGGEMDPNILAMGQGVEQDDDKYKRKWDKYILNKNTLLAEKWTVRCHPPKQSKIDIGIKV
jgi:hypothetical protein